MIDSFLAITILGVIILLLKILLHEMNLYEGTSEVVDCALSSFLLGFVLINIRSSMDSSGVYDKLASQLGGNEYFIRLMV